MAQSSQSYSTGSYQSPPVAQQPYQGNTTPQDSQACYNCGSSQHWAQFCPEPRRQVPAGSIRGKPRAPKNTNNTSANKKASRPVITRYAPPPGYVPPGPTPVTPSTPSYSPSVSYGTPAYGQTPQPPPMPTPAPQQWQQSPQSYSAPQWQQSPTVSYGPQQPPPHSAYSSAPQTPYSTQPSPAQSYPAQSFSTPQAQGYATQPALHNNPTQPPHNGYPSHPQTPQYHQPVPQHQPPLPPAPTPTHYNQSPTQYSQPQPQPQAQPAAFTPYQPPPFTGHSSYQQNRPSPASYTQSPNQQFPPQHTQHSHSNSHSRHNHHNHSQHNQQNQHNQHSQHNQHNQHNRGGRGKRFRPATPSENIPPRPPSPPTVFPQLKLASIKANSPLVWKPPQPVDHPISANPDEPEEHNSTVPLASENIDKDTRNISGTKYFTSSGMQVDMSIDWDSETDNDPAWKSVRTGGSTRVELEEYKWEDDKEAKVLLEQLKKNLLAEEVKNSNGLPAAKSTTDISRTSQPEGKKRSWDDSFNQKSNHEQDRRPNKRRHGNDGRNRRGNRSGQARQGKGFNNRNAGTGPSVPTLQIPASNAPPVQRSFHPLPPKPTTVPPPPPSAAYLEKLPETSDRVWSGSANAQSGNSRRSASPDTGNPQNGGWRQRDYDRSRANEGPNGQNFSTAGDGETGRVPNNADVRRRGSAAMEVYNRRW